MSTRSSESKFRACREGTNTPILRMLLFVVRLWSGGTHVLCELDRGVPKTPSYACPPRGGQLLASGGSARGRPTCDAQAGVAVFARQDTRSETTHGAVVNGLPPVGSNPSLIIFYRPGGAPNGSDGCIYGSRRPLSLASESPVRPRTRYRYRKCHETHSKEPPPYPVIHRPSTL